METKSKLAILELIAGLLGWVWIGASIAALYFLAMAVLSDGTWSQFFWALGAGVIAKWLARGFEDNKKRVAYEAQPQSSDATAIIQAYGKVLETSAPVPGCVADESKLPYPKETIKKAIIAGLRSTEDKQMKEHFKVGYIQLADWQPDIGENDQGLDLSAIDGSQDTESLASAVLEQSSGSEAWVAIAQKEQEALKQELEELGLW